MLDTARAFDMQGLLIWCGTIARLSAVFCAAFLGEAFGLQSRSLPRESPRFNPIERCPSPSSPSVLQHTGAQCRVSPKHLLHPNIVHDSLSDKI